MLKVNISPLFRSHCLYVPQLLQILPQIINTQEVIQEIFSLFRGKDMMPAGDQLWIGYNSRGAFSTVNHLHFHLGIIAELLQPGESHLYI